MFAAIFRFLLNTFWENKEQQPQVLKLSDHPNICHQVLGADFFYVSLKRKSIIVIN